MEHEEYLGDLAQNLRWRRIDDSAVLEVLRDVSREVHATGSTPADRFGDADTYAERFERGHTVSVGYLIAPSAPCWRRSSPAATW